MYLSLQFGDFCFLSASSKKALQAEKRSPPFSFQSHYIVVYQVEWRQWRLMLVPLRLCTLWILIDSEGESDPALIPSSPTPARQNCWGAPIWAGCPFLRTPLATCKAWPHSQPWWTFPRGPENDGFVFPAVGHGGFRQESWPRAGEWLSYYNTCPSTSQECHQHKMAS